MKNLITAILFCGMIGGAYADDCFIARHTGGPYMIAFDNNSAELSKQCKIEVKQVLNSLPIDSCKYIDMWGSTDTTASEKYNADLSEKRVYYVYDLLDAQHKDIVHYRSPHSAGETDASRNIRDNASVRSYRVVYVYYANSENCVPCTRGGDSKYDQCDSKCSSESGWSDLYSQYENMCPESSTFTEEQYQSYQELDQKLLEFVQGGCCGDYGKVVIEINNSQTNINAVIAKIKKLDAQLSADKTVWRDANGKFNTARLASDSIAAVVLGTAGGLITSHVIKKNQVENGFEDINCSIGGQTVSGWGDEFNVGIQ